MEKEQKITKAELARRKREEKLAAERERIEALCEFEKNMITAGISAALMKQAEVRLQDRLWQGRLYCRRTAAFYISMIPRN